jgi:hypothetical protein
LEPEILLLILRMVSAILLLGILTALFVIIWRDYRAAIAAAERSRRTYGTLVALAKIDQQLLPTGAQYPLLPFTSLGRAPTNSVTIPNSFASGEHALLALRSGQWWLEDRQSTNGTLLNGEPVTVPVIVTDGDIIGIGNHYFRIHLE